MDAILLKQGQFEQLYAYFSPALREQLPFEDIRKALKLFQLNMKTIETRQLSDRIQWRDDVGRYIIDMWQEGEVITHFQMTEVLDDWTKSRFAFPFEETWRTVYADERYIFQKTTADPSIQIVAPVKGVVEKVSADGVTIRHQHDEYSYINGFTPHVLVGKKVGRGTFLGTTGASHTLHFQVLRTSDTVVRHALTVNFGRHKMLMKGDSVSNTHGTKTEKLDVWSDRASFVELLVDIGGFILWIPRAIFQLFK